MKQPFFFEGDAQRIPDQFIIIDQQHLDFFEHIEWIHFSSRWVEPIFRKPSL